MFTNYTYEDEDKNDYLNKIDEEIKSKETNRAAGVSHADHGDIGSTSSPSAKEKTAVSDKGSSLSLWTPQHVAFLDQHIFLGKDARASDTFQFINEQLIDISEGYQNFRVYPNEYKTVGYHLDETREGCYRIQLFTYNDKLGVNCTRLDGDSLALCSLWSQLKKRLHESEFYVDKFLAEGDDDDDIFGDEDDDLDMDSFKYLDFSRDEAFVSKMVEDILDVNVGTHALMLLKFNFQKEKNLQLVADKFSQNLFDNTVERLTAATSTLPAAICASHILTSLLAQAAALAVTAEQVSNMVNAAERWSSEDVRASSSGGNVWKSASEEQDWPRTIVPTASEEAATLLLESVSQAAEKLSEGTTEIDLQDRLQRIYDRTSFDQVRDQADALLASN